MAHEKQLKAAIGAAKAAGKVLLKHYGTGLTKKMKGKLDFATQADLESQALIKRSLASAFPGYSFLGEEDKSHSADYGGYKWIVDPLDGTINYALGLPWFCVSIALAKDGEPVVGVLYQPLSRELFTATKGGGAFLNGKRISVSKKPLEELALGISISHLRNNTLRVVKHLPFLQPACLRIRSIGSIAEEVCNVASGRFGAYYNLISTPWDFSAAKVVVEEAGGVASDIEGKHWRPDSPNILVANSRRSQKILIDAIRKGEKK